MALTGGLTKSSSMEQFIVSQVEGTIKRLGAAIPYANTILGLAIGPAGCSQYTAEAGTVDRAVVSDWESTVFCNCPKNSAMNKNMCAKSLCLLSVLPDSGNSFYSILSSTVFTALGYDHRHIVPMAGKFAVKGAGGQTLAILGRANQPIPIYLGGRRALLLNPVIMNCIKGAELILSPGALADVGCRGRPRLC